VVNGLRALSKDEQETDEHTFEVGLSTMPLSASAYPATHRRKTWSIDWDGSAGRLRVSC